MAHAHRRGPRQGRPELPPQHAAAGPTSATTGSSDATATSTRAVRSTSRAPTPAAATTWRTSGSASSATSRAALPAAAALRTLDALPATRRCGATVCRRPALRPPRLQGDRVSRRRALRLARDFKAGVLAVGAGSGFRRARALGPSTPVSPRSSHACRTGSADSPSSGQARLGVLRLLALSEPQCEPGDLAAPVGRADALGQGVRDHAEGPARVDLTQRHEHSGARDALVLPAVDAERTLVARLLQVVADQIADRVEVGGARRGAGRPRDTIPPGNGRGRPPPTRGRRACQAPALPGSNHRPKSSVRSTHGCRMRRPCSLQEVRPSAPRWLSSS